MTDIGANQQGESFAPVGNRYDPTVPSWAQIASGTNTVLSTGTTVRGAANSSTPTPADQYPFDSRSADLTAAWSGGCLVEIDGRPYLVVKGGGHTDGSWNGHVGFGPLTGAAGENPTWSIVFQASAIGDVREDSVTYSDGQHTATHTYGNLVGVGDTLYEMATASMFSPSGGFFGGEGFKTVNGTTQTQLANDNPALRQEGACDHYNGKIYYMGQGASGNHNLKIFDVAAETWTSESAGTVASTDDGALAVDTTGEGILSVNPSEAYYWDIATLTRRTVNAPGSTSATLVYDPVRDVFATLSGNNATLREIDAATLAAGGNPSWGTRGYSGTPLSGLESLGTYGRFRYVTQLGGYIVAPNSDSNVWFFKS